MESEPCYLCNKPLAETEGYQCCRCEEIACDACKADCFISCTEPFCKKCEFKCNKCKKQYCEGHVVGCSEKGCHNLMCDNDKRKCHSCMKVFCDDHWSLFNEDNQHDCNKKYPLNWY